MIISSADPILTSALRAPGTFDTHLSALSADAIALAEVMVDTAKRMGKKCVALITDMGQPLGRCSRVCEAPGGC